MEKLPPYKGDKNKTPEERQKEARDYFMDLMGEPHDVRDETVLKHIEEEHEEFSLKKNVSPKTKEILHGAEVPYDEFAPELDAITGISGKDERREATYEARELVAERPDFGPRQVKMPDELKEGETYIIHMDSKPTEIVVLLEPPFARENGRMFVKARHVSGDYNGDMDEYNLARIGILPYQTPRGPLWSPTYWVERAE